MVKGVSKTVIEVNNTGSRLFEKIVFYVTPEYGNLSAKQLKKAASSFSFNFESTALPKSAAKRRKRRRLRPAVWISAATFAAVILLLILIL